MDGNKLRDSYLAMLDAEMNPDQLAELWTIGRKQYPQFTQIIWDQFQEVRTKKTSDSQRERIAGATFMFLSLVNALADEPVIDFRSIGREIPPLPESMDFPTFGLLSRLSPKKPSSKL